MDDRELRVGVIADNDTAQKKKIAEAKWKLTPS